MTVYLHAEQVYLRAIQLDDASTEYLSWLNDPETTRGLMTGAFPSNLDDLKKYIDGVSASKDAVMFAICDNITHKHIGNIKIDRFDWIGRTCELGILIGSKEHRGRGIGTEVCKVVLQYAFNRLNIRKVLLAVYANNPGAIKSYEKVGFQHEGVLRKHVFSEGQFVDKHFMGIFKEELV